MRLVVKPETVALFVPVAIGVGVIGGLWCAELAGGLRVKVVVPINDNDIKRCRRCDGGKYSLKEV